jgi:hypothetical protein
MGEEAKGMSKSKGLSPAEHLELGRLLKRNIRGLQDAAKLARCYGRLSDELYDAADLLMRQRSWLEKRLIEDVGTDATISGTHVKEVYFGNVSAMEAEDA